MAVLLVQGDMLAGCDGFRTCVLMEKRIARGVAVGGALAHTLISPAKGVAQFAATCYVVI